MKRIFMYRLGLIIIMGSVILVSTAQAERRYEFKSALIEYNITGHIQGTETAYIDDYGQKESRYSEYDLQLTGHDGPQKRYTLRQDDMLTNVDLNKNLSIDFDLTKEVVPGGLDIRLTAKEMADFSEEGLKKMRAVRVGEETIAGKTCALYELPFLKSKVWIYKKIPLRYTSNTRGFQVSYLATAIQENVPIEPSKFEIPAGVRSIGVAPENNIMGATQPVAPVK